MVTRARHLAKAVSYRLFGSLGTATLVYLATGDAGIGASIGALETVGKIGLYYLHERALYRIKWGVGPDPVGPPERGEGADALAPRRG